MQSECWSHRSCHRLTAGNTVTPVTLAAIVSTVSSLLWMGKESFCTTNEHMVADEACYSQTIEVPFTSDEYNSVSQCFATLWEI